MKYLDKLMYYTVLIGVLTSLVTIIDFVFFHAVNYYLSVAIDFNNEKAILDTWHKDPTLPFSMLLHIILEYTFDVVISIKLTNNYIDPLLRSIFDINKNADDDILAKHGITVTSIYKKDL